MADLDFRAVVRRQIFYPLKIVQTNCENHKAKLKRLGGAFAEATAITKSAAIIAKAVVYSYLNASNFYKYKYEMLSKF